jgi:hypothetical protein
MIFFFVLVVARAGFDNAAMTDLGRSITYATRQNKPQNPSKTQARPRYLD